MLQDELWMRQRDKPSPNRRSRFFFKTNRRNRVRFFEFWDRFGSVYRKPISEIFIGFRTPLDSLLQVLCWWHMSSVLWLCFLNARKGNWLAKRLGPCAFLPRLIKGTVHYLWCLAEQKVIVVELLLSSGSGDGDDGLVAFQRYLQQLCEITPKFGVLGLPNFGGKKPPKFLMEFYKSGSPSTMWQSLVMISQATSEIRQRKKE